MASIKEIVNDSVVRPTAATAAISTNMLRMFSTSRPWSLEGTNDTAPISASTTANSQKQR